MNNNIINIINLPHRQDRVIKVRYQMEAQGIKNVRFWCGYLDQEKPSRGIAKAHQQIVSFARRNGLPEIIIAEDDLEFTSLGAFDYFLSQEPDTYDLYLGGVSYGNVIDGGQVKDFAGTHFYKIRNQFYETFLSLTGEKDIDRDLANRGKYFVCDPMIAIQADGFSDNLREYRENKLYFKNRNLWTGYQGD